MENKYKFILLLFISIICCLSTVNAEDVGELNDTNLFSSNEEPVDSVSASDLDDNLNNNFQQGSFKDLQTDIDNAKDVINLTRDYTFHDGDSGVKISKKITINGNNHIIDAKNNCRIFTITAPHVTLINLTFINGYSTDNGGAIYTTWNDLTIKESKFVNNHAKNGGAIYACNNPTRFNLINSEFTNNTAQYGKGGAIFCSGYNSNIINTKFIGNNAQNGGSIYWGESKKVLGKTTIYGNEANVINSTFVKNSAVNGGAVFWYANTGKIINSTFKQNYGYNADNGGAIYWKGESGVVDNVKFIENTAESCAGAIYWEGSHGTVLNSTFINNTAFCIGSQFKGGGAIMWKGKYGLIKDSNFTSNIAYTEGGAINWYETNDAKGEIFNCNFQNNKALAGSAIFMHYGSLDINDSSFFNNQAGSDGITCDITKENNIFHLTSVFTGNDNMINAIYNYKLFNEYWQINFNNTKYWGIDGVMNTNDGEIVIDDHESRIKINFEVYDKNNNLVGNLTAFTDINGVAKVDVKGLNPGNYTVKAIHYEDCYYDEISKSKTFEVDKLSTKIIAKHVWDNALTHDDIKVNVLDENNNSVQSGKCILLFEDSQYESDVIDGVAVFKNVEMPNPGYYDEIINYVGNEHYYSSVGDVEITVLKLDTYTYDHNVTPISQHEILVVVTVVDEFNNPVLSGEVELDVYYEDEINNQDSPILKATKDSFSLSENKKVYYAQIENGEAIFDIVLAHNGHYLIDAEYKGYKLYNPSEDIVGVDSYALNTTIKSDDITAKSGETRDITCDVVDQDNNPVKNGSVILKIGDNTYEASVIDGKATFEDVMMPDSDSIAYVEYIGNDDYNSSNSTFNITIENNNTENTTHGDNNTNDTNVDVIIEPPVSIFPPDIKLMDTTSVEDTDFEEDEDMLSHNVTGNPLFAILIVFTTLVCNICLKRRK